MITVPLWGKLSCDKTLDFSRVLRLTLNHYPVVETERSEDETRPFQCPFSCMLSALYHHMTHPQVWRQCTFQRLKTSQTLAVHSGWELKESKSLSYSFDQHLLKPKELPATRHQASSLSGHDDADIRKSILHLFLILLLLYSLPPLTINPSNERNNSCSCW